MTFTLNWYTLVAAVLAAGCSQQTESKRHAAMLKRFSEIDSNFIYSIALINSNDQVEAASALPDLSNSIVLLSITTTNLQDFTNQVEVERVNSILLLKLQKAGMNFAREYATNLMLIAKLNWFYTNQMPVADDPPVDRFVEESQALSETVVRKRMVEAARQGLDQIEQLKTIVSTLTNAPKPASEEEVNRLKKEQQLEQQRQQLQVAAIQRSAVRLYGSVIQVLDDGMLIRYGTSSGSYNQPDHLVGFVQNRNLNAFADGDTISGRVAYPIGTYKYESKGGDTKVVRRFTLNYNDAAAFANGQ